MSSSDPPPPKRGYDVKIDPSLAVSHVSGARQAELDRALEAVLQRVPVAARDEMRRQLTDARATPVSSTDPEMARLLSVVVSLRASDDQAFASLQLAAAEESAERREPPLRLIIALAAELPRQDARAVVVRRPGDEGIPVVLVRESDATPEDLERGVRAAFAAKERYGHSVEGRIDIVVSRTPSEPTASNGVWALYLAEASRRAPSTISGIGTVRAISTASYRPVKR